MTQESKLKGVQKMGSDNNPRYNASGCADPTAYAALKPIIKEDAEIERKAYEVVKIVKIIIGWAGFELVQRVQIKHRKTGKEFR